MVQLSALDAKHLRSAKVGLPRLQAVSKNDEICIKYEEFRIKNEELCIENEGFCIRNDELCRSPVCSTRQRPLSHLRGLSPGRRGRVLRSSWG